MADNSKLIIASLKAGKEIKISVRDYLVVQQYAESIGMKLEVVGRAKNEVTVRTI